MQKRTVQHQSYVRRSLVVLAGLVLLVVALPPFFDFPWLGFWLLPMAAIYLFLLLLLPRLWLLVLPIATVGVDIAPFTGRASFTELDLLFAVTLASGLLFKRYRFKVYMPSLATVVLALYLVVVLLGFSGWAYLLLPPQSATENPYYANEYAFRMLKGIIWGVALVPMWGFLLRVDKRRAVTMLVVGFGAASLLLAVLVLWERGTLGVILTGSAWYHIVSSLLDLSWSYRVTGVFSDMHTGGEALDGVLLLSLPVALYGMIYCREAWLRVGSAVTVLALAYVTLVGFTRATYAAYALTLITFALLTLKLRHSNRRPLSWPLTLSLGSLCLNVFAAYFANRYAGSYGLMCLGLLVALAGLTIYFEGRRARYACYAIVTVLVVFAVYAQFTSRWVEPSVFGVVSLVVFLPLAYVMGCKLFRQCEQMGRLDQLMLVGVAVLVPIFAAFALGGSQINDRFARVSSDLDTRINHWSSVIASGGGGLIGSGVGSFPAHYIARYPERVVDVGSFTIVKENRRDALELGAGRDLAIGQRVTIEPYTIYTVKAHIRSNTPGRLSVALCERNMLYPNNFVPKCERANLEVGATEGAFEEYSTDINSNRIGEWGSLRRWPTILEIRNNEPDTVLYIDAIDLSADGFNQLQNGSFKQGLDYWFFYNDYSHLPWHIKNTFLQVWFESGWLGLILFVAMFALLLRSCLSRRSYDSLLPVYATGVLAICFFGVFGSPLDSPRASWTFYFFLASGLAHLRGARLNDNAKALQ